MASHTYVVSTGRTGTKALAELFNEYEVVRGVHEALPPLQKGGVEYAHGDLNGFGEWKMKWLFWVSRIVHDDINVRQAYPEYDREEARGRFPFILPAFSPVNVVRNGAYRLYNRVFDAPSDYVEANNFLFSLIPLIREVFPEATIIHVVRDGRGFVKSALNRDYFAEEDFRAHLRGDKYGDMTLQEWQNLNKLQKNAWLWVNVNQVIEDHEPDLRVSFNDMFRADGRPGLRRICDEAGLPYDEDVVEEVLATKTNRAENELFPAFESWIPSWKEQFWEIAGEQMETYGYERREQR